MAEEEKIQQENYKQEEVNENISPPETIEQTEPKIGTSDITTSDTQNMEVHHHPNVEKKNLKEYLLEGLMIFLAVSMGFIAENIRESITKHEKAETFAASMKNDLMADTAQLNIYVKNYRTAANNIDTFMQLLSANIIVNIPSGKLYWYGLFGGMRGSFIPNDATFQQMKSSGSIELFKSQTAIDVEKYDRLCRSIQVADEMNRDIYTKVRETRALIFDFKYNEMANQVAQKNKQSYNQVSVDSFIATNPPLLSTNNVLFNQYVELVRSRFVRTYNVGYADSLLKQANIVLSDLNNDFK